MDVTLPDGVVVKGVPDGTTKEQLLHKLLNVRHPSAQNLLDQVSQQQTLNETSGLGKFNAGVGGALTRIGQGAKQMVGMDTDYQRDRGATDALNKTGAGLTGNVVGNIAALAPMAVLPGAASVGGAAALGAMSGALQPTDTTAERVKNMGVGALTAGTVQGAARYPAEIADAAKGVGRGLKATVEPFTEEGRRTILSRTLRNASEGNPQAAANMAAARELVPGSQPTAAEVAQSPGIAALQRTMSATNPEAYATRAAQQNEARVRALENMTGGLGGRAAAESSRDAQAAALYGQARTQGLDPAVAQMLKPQIKNLMERMPSGVLEKAKELARMNGEVFDKGGSVNGMHWIKLAVDDALSAGKQTGIGSQTTRALTQFKDDLLTVMDDLSPAYGRARMAYAEASKPINQMSTAQEIADRSINPLTGAMKPQQFANALDDGTAASATGFRGATLDRVFTPRQQQTLENLRQDLARSVAARDLGRGPGSDTVQKLAMSNLLQRSGLPESVMRTPLLGRVGNWAYENADARMKQQLAEALLNPQAAARLLNAAPAQGLPAQTDPRIGEKAAALARMLMLPAISQGVQ